jgi:GT2 family glycosyltransferase
VISVIVVNHDGGSQLRQCLASLGGSGSGVEVLLVDNASTDDSVALVRAEFPHVRVLEQRANIGFGAANNLAAAEARGRALLLLNADAWLEEGALALLEARLERERRLALVAPRLLYPDGRRQFAWSPERNVFGEALQQVRNRHEGRGWAHGFVLRALSRMLGRIWYTAACVLVRADAYSEVGGFDERFFMYFEDVDLCVRLEAAGWRLGQEPRAVARHAGGFARRAAVDELYRPSQLRYYAIHRPAWERRFMEQRLRRRFGDRTVDGWLAGGEAG